MSQTDAPPTDAAAEAAAKAEFHARLQTYVGRSVGTPIPAPDEVNVPMVRHWCEALGDRNPVYLDAEAAAASVHGGLVAPPTMLQAWVMRPVFSSRADGGPNPYNELLDLMDRHGFVSVVATNCEQVYDRYLRPGDRLTMTTTIDAVSQEKTTGLGVGHFITTRQDYWDADGNRVGSMLFRILKFRPPAKEPPPKARPPRPRPSITYDYLWWFEALKEGRFLLQRCTSCGTLRYPPGPACGSCTSLAWEAVESVGTGTIHSHVVVHYPQVPSFDYPLPIALVQLDDGVRIVVDVAADPAEVAIGKRVRIRVVQHDPDLALPQAVLDPASDGSS